MPMIAFLAGNVGSGKTSLARALSTRTGYLHFDIDEVKKRVYPTDPDYEYNMDHGIPFSDETRARVFETVVSDFANLSQTHRRLIVDETFHKEALRQIVFEGATRYFRDYIIVNVIVDEELIRQRLLAKPREGHILDDPWKMYLGIRDSFEPFNEPYLEFRNEGNFEDSVTRLHLALKERGF